MEQSDEQLINNYFSGGEESLEILIKRYLKPIYSFSYRYVNNFQDAEDIAQDVFVKIWRNLKKFDKKKSFRIWIFAIAKNACLDWLKKKKAIPFSNFENEQGENIVLEKLTDPTPLASKISEQIGVAEILNSAIQQLPLRYRPVIFLHYNDHFTFGEIAEILDEPLNTVKSQHRRALIQLKKLLAD